MSGFSILRALDDPNLFRPAFPGETWRPWRSFLACLFGLDGGDPDLIRRATGRGDLPAGRFSEAWIVAGRRSGKSRILSLVACYLAAFRDWREHTAPGELAIVALIAADREQARVSFRYCRGLMHGNPMLRQMIVAEKGDRIELANRGAVEVLTSGSAAVRGRSLAAAILDEVAFWPVGDAADPDSEILAAIRPALANLPGSILLAASSPYARRGELWRAYETYHGREGSDVLVWRSSAREMNPGLSAAMIARELARDPARAAAEWEAVFRADIESFISREAVEACTVPGRLELPPMSGQLYAAFCDPSGGSGGDAMTMAVAHREAREDGEVAVLDAVREVRPPFKPASVVAEFADLLRRYQVGTVTGDRYGGQWVSDAFKAAGIVYQPAAKSRSELYLDLLPRLNSGEVELLDNPRLKAQLVGLERRSGRNRDVIDHAPGQHDDLANAAAGALTAGAAPFLYVGGAEPLGAVPGSDPWTWGQPQRRGLTAALSDPTAPWGWQDY